MSKPYIKVEDNTKKFLDSVFTLKGKRTLVGIPQDENSRGDGEIGNAAILFINNFGSPANNIPPRPVMDIGIRRSQDEITKEFESAVKAMGKGPDEVDKYFNRAGIVASNSVKTVINEQIDIEGPAKSTLESREAKGFKGTKSLVVTGQLRNAITYVVEG